MWKTIYKLCLALNLGFHALFAMSFLMVVFLGATQLVSLLLGLFVAMVLTFMLEVNVKNIIKKRGL